MIKAGVAQLASALEEAFIQSHSHMMKLDKYSWGNEELSTPYSEKSARKIQRVEPPRR